MSIAKYATRDPKPLSQAASMRREPDLFEDVLEMLIGLVTSTVCLLLTMPVFTSTALVLAGIYWKTGPVGLVIAVAVPVLGLLTWRLAHPASFRRLVAARVRSVWRRWFRYAGQWQPVLMAHGLSVSRGQESPMVPRLLPRARCDAWTDRLRVDLVPGLGPEDVEREASNLAHAFGAISCTVTVLKPGRVQLAFTVRDRLADPVPVMPLPDSVRLTAVPVGVREDGQPWTVPAIGTHVLIAGATGSGKGSVLWSLLRGLLPDITAGRVEVWGIDPKGGMELGFGRDLFTRLAQDGIEEMATLLEDAVAVMDARAQQLAGNSRLHEPAPGAPLLVVVIDELASLTAYVKDRDLKKRIDAALQQLLSKGRAPGVTVVGALQDPRKEVLGYRDLFPTRVALRLAEKEQVGMVLGDNAWDRGAHCERIPADLPGVGYVLVDGQPEPVRVRAAHVTGDDIRAMASEHPAPASVLAVPERPVTDAADVPLPRRPRRDAPLEAVPF